MIGTEIGNHIPWEPPSIIDTQVRRKDSQAYQASVCFKYVHMYSPINLGM